MALGSLRPQRLRFNQALINHFVDMDQPTTEAPLRQAAQWNVSGGQFNTLRARSITQQNITNVNSALTPRDSFDFLRDKVSPSAFHNSAQRVDPPRCHAHTRTAILDILIKWAVAQSSEKDMMWVYGAAGAGKSAIAQSLTELCIKNGIVVVSFFFCRTDTTRNTVRPLVPTLVYQLIVIIPSIRTLVLDAIEKDPLIFEKSLDEQVLLLIIRPLERVQQAQNWHLPTLILIDGLDECSGKDVQVNIIHTFSNGIQGSPTPFRVLITSRAEPHLVMVLNSRTVKSSLERLPLDDKYLPDKDIRKFVGDHFALIHESHPLARLLEPDWPASQFVDQIVAKSSGQFIYASVVMKYVSSPHAHPAKSLEIIRGLLPPRSTAPFAQLDALYSHIFSEVEELESVQPILALALLAITTNTSLITSYLGLISGDVESLLSVLTSVIRVDEAVSFLHASLPDFLFDKARSQKYHLNAGAWAERLSRILLKRGKEGKPPNLVSLRRLLQQADPTPSLEQDLLEFVPTQRYRREAQNASALLSTIFTMKFENTGNIYQIQLMRWVRFFKSTDHQIEDVADTGQHHVKIALAEIAKADLQAAVSTVPFDASCNPSVHSSYHEISESLPDSLRRTSSSKLKADAESDAPRRGASSLTVVDIPKTPDHQGEPVKPGSLLMSGTARRPKKARVLSLLSNATQRLWRDRKL